MIKISLLISLLFSQMTLAELKVADIFTDHCVLQQGMNLPVWGTANVGDKVTVTFNGKNQTTRAGSDGKWKISLSPLEASFKSASLVVESGKDKLTLKDILVGEVWICSGQSNMQMEVSKVPEVKKLVNKSKHIRSFEVKHMVAFEEQDTLDGKWTVTHPVSAVAFSFAYYLHQHGDVPIGIIHSSWGSSGIEAWMPRDMEQTVPHFKTIMQEFDADTKTKQKIQSILDGKRPWSRNDDVFLRRQSNLLYNAMIHPLSPYACRGLVWYQGERNTQSMQGMLTTPWYSRNSGMLKYGDTLKAWIQRYRKQWGNEEMHFLTVMLPGYHKALKTGKQKGHDHPDAHSWAWMRESQLKSLELNHTNVVTTIDLGDLKNIHPKDKLPIGQRLALLAARDTLGKDLIAQGPTVKNVEKADGKLIIHFDHAEGLKTPDNKAPTSFWIADDSQKWVRAEATLKGESVVLKAKEVSQPLYVRYAFTGKPEVNLVNGADLPATPFRSDTFSPK